jgi:hypothetical protein
VGHGLALAAASGARPSGSKVNGAVGLTALAQHIVVVAGSRLDREGCGLRATNPSQTILLNNTASLSQRSVQ